MGQSVKDWTTAGREQARAAWAEQEQRSCVSEEAVVELPVGWSVVLMG